ncbi:MAG: sulfotransferase [Verrucomicrobiota bacterium]
MTAIVTHPLVSGRFGNLVTLARRYGISPRHIPAFAGVIFLSLLRQPGIWFEGRRYEKRISGSELPSNPVFVIGHWRSGTTHLQNLLSQDPQFESMTIREAAMPLDFLTLGKVFRRQIEKAVPKKRLMDNVAMSADSPWEEELALVASCPFSFYHVSFFPNAMERIFQNAVFFDGRDPTLIEAWRREYLYFLRKVSLVRPGKPFLLKNPANTARIDLLLEMFPRARFIHIHRNPYDVFRSTVDLYLKAQTEWGFHPVDRNRIVEHVLESYPLLMTAYLEQRDLVPKDCLVEVAFMDLEAKPMETLSSIYSDLSLEGSTRATDRFQHYLREVGNYRKNDPGLAEEEKRRVRSEWESFFDAFGYEV